MSCVFRFFSIAVSKLLMQYARSRISILSKIGNCVFILFQRQLRMAALLAAPAQAFFVVVFGTIFDLTSQVKGRVLLEAAPP